MGVRRVFRILIFIVTPFRTFECLAADWMPLDQDDQRVLVKKT
jgi:hypothetical protein